MSLLGMTELPKKFEKYDMLEYLASSVPHDKKEYTHKVVVWKKN